MTGLFFALIGAVILNSFLNIGVLGLLIGFGIGAFGVFILVFSTSGVLMTRDADSPIPGALMLFAGVFNVFVATLNILLRVMNGGRRSWPTALVRVPWFSAADSAPPHGVDDAKPCESRRLRAKNS